MSFLELARRRCSIRSYRPDPVEAEKLQAVLEAGRLAPSACNRQPWHFVVLRDPERKALLKQAYARDWFWTAPVIIAVCADVGAAWVRPQDGKRHADVDAAIAVDHMTLCAEDLGLGTCWVCHFDPKVARAVLELPEGIEPIAMLPLGYPAAGGKPKDRKPLDGMVSWERYGGR